MRNWTKFSNGEIRKKNNKKIFWSVVETFFKYNKITFVSFTEPYNWILTIFPFTRRLHQIWIFWIQTVFQKLKDNKQNIRNIPFLNIENRWWKTKINNFLAYLKPREVRIYNENKFSKSICKISRDQQTSIVICSYRNYFEKYIQSFRHFFISENIIHRLLKRLKTERWIWNIKEIMVAILYLFWWYILYALSVALKKIDYY